MQLRSQFTHKPVENLTGIGCTGHGFVHGASELNDGGAGSSPGGAGSPSGVLIRRSERGKGFGSEERFFPENPLAIATRLSVVNWSSAGGCSIPRSGRQGSRPCRCHKRRAMGQAWVISGDIT